MNGKMTQKPWRNKNEANHIADNAKLPGKCVSVDQIISTVPGLIIQVKGIPTRKRYQIATIFVDHASDYTYIHFQTDSTSAETLAAKHSFERHANGVGVTIKKYHADNGRFIDKAWTNDMAVRNQDISLCGVNAHHQNGKVEKRIRDVQELARTSLLHAMKKWPDAVNEFFWPLIR
jgi:hypothetical protein